jgi:signal transduction histidine kinase
MDDEWGVGWAEAVHFEDLQNCLDAYVDAFNARRPFEIEYRLQRHDGEYRWIMDRGNPRYREDGTFAGFIGSCVDITDIKALQRDLQATVRAREDFLSIASHELRTPLTTAQLQVASLLRHLKSASGRTSPERLVDKAESVQGQMVRLAELIQVLLDVSRISAGKLELELVAEDMDLAALVTDTARRLEPQAVRVGCAINVVAPRPVWGHWDPVRLDQVVTNLLINALKYAPGAPVHVGITTEADFGRLVVADQGMGIAAETQRRMFGRFERGVSARHGGGLGLGLWITREILEAHGGSIRVESVIGQGATFTVDLPTQQRGIRATNGAASGEGSGVTSPRPWFR